MALPLGLAALIQGVYLWHIHTWTYHNGDATYYDLQAHWITKGYWFVNPYLASYGFGVTPSASHPPLTTLVLALSDFVGATTWGWHQVVMALLFVVTVAICGQVGRMLAGDRAGIIVALVVASYPYLWVNAGAALSESVELPITALLLWASLRFWTRPRLRTAAEIGLYLGLAALTRSELILYVVLIGIPLVLLCRGLTRAGRLKSLAVMVLAVVVVLGPWVGRNMVAFHHPEYLSSEGGVTLATANCGATYYGPNEGWWYYHCYPNVKLPPHSDESDTDKAMRHLGEHYIRTHESQLPFVMAVRVLRAWDLYSPIQQARFDQLDDRPIWASELGMVYFFMLVPFAVAGVVVLRRRKVLVFPLVALVVTATLAAALIYANGRYRVEGDLGVAILGAVGVNALIDLWWRRRRSAPADVPAVPDPRSENPLTGTTVGPSP